MNTIVFSDYDTGLCSSIVLLTSDSLPKIYQPHCTYPGEVEDLEDDALFSFFTPLFDKPIERIVIIINGTVRKIRYDGKYFPETGHRYFGYNVEVDGSYVPYVSTEITIFPKGE